MGTLGEDTLRLLRDGQIARAISEALDAKSNAPLDLKVTTSSATDAPDAPQTEKRVIIRRVSR